MENSLAQILNENSKRILVEETALLQEIEKIPGLQANLIAPLHSALSHIDELFLLVIVGEVKSGKSSFINALFGKKICKEGVTPVTDKINVLCYGENDQIREVSPFLLEHNYPFELLKNLHVIDTPGTNSLVREHQEITEKFIPHSDLVIFLTSIDRPFTESERRLLEFIKDEWGKKIIFVLNKIDIKESQEVEEVLQYIRSNCQSLLNFDPLIFCVSAKSAYEGKTKDNQELLQKSQFQPLEQYLFQTLSQEERIKLKFSGPLFIANKALDGHAKNLQKLLDMSNLDIEVIHEMTQIVQYEERIIRQNYQNDISTTHSRSAALRDWGTEFLENQLNITSISCFWQKAGRPNEESLKMWQQLLTELQARIWEKLGHSVEAIRTQIVKVITSKFHNAECSQSSDISQSIVTPENHKMQFNQAVQTLRGLVEPGTILLPLELLAKQHRQQGFAGIAGGLGVFLIGLLLGGMANSILLQWLAIIGLAGGAFWAWQQKQHAIRKWNHLSTEKIKQIQNALTESAVKYIEAILPKFQEIISTRQNFILAEQTKLADQKKALEIYRAKISALDTKIKQMGSKPNATT